MAGITVAAAKRKLGAFLKANPYSEVGEAKTSKGDQLRVQKPWGDSTLAMVIDEDFAELAKALNKVVLPERLAAIWHTDLKCLEVIWTAYNLPPAAADLYGREFEIAFKGVTRKCRFGLSSNRLLTIAKKTAPLGPAGPTVHRNISSFSIYARTPADKREGTALNKPVSFWIDNIKWNEGEVIDFINHLNFYMTYYDSNSVHVLVFPPNAEVAITKKTRYIDGSFPQKINARCLDDNLMSFRMEAHSEANMMSFLWYYRIIEYAGTGFVDDNTRDALKKIISDPSLPSSPSESVERILLAMNDFKMRDHQRFDAVVKHCVKPKLLWNYIDANRNYFTKSHRFDGDFAVDRLIIPEDNEKTFDKNGIDAFCRTTREIRNTLAHGRDQITTGVITPTTKNVKLIKPWLDLISIAAAEVILYRHIT